jgi:hypothetical protein
MNNNENKLVQYVREPRGSRRGQLRGVVVAIPNEKTKWLVGWSYCRTTLDSFDREMGLKIALGRCYSPTKAAMPNDVKPVYKHMVKRAEKYYQ